MLEFIWTDRICFGLVEHTKLSVRMTDRNIWFSETLHLCIFAISESSPLGKECGPSFDKKP